MCGLPFCIVGLGMPHLSATVLLLLYAVSSIDRLGVLWDCGMCMDCACCQYNAINIIIKHIVIWLL
jgi:hypothetical protein